MNRRSHFFVFVSIIALLMFCKIEVSRAAGATNTVYDCTGDKNITNPFPEFITPAEVEEMQRTTVSSRPFPYIEKVYYTEVGQEFSLQTAHQAHADFQPNYYKKSLSRIDSFIFIPRVKKNYVYDGDGEIRNLPYSYAQAAADGSIPLNENTAVKGTLPFTLYINGKLVGEKLTEKKQFTYNMHDNQTFIHIVYHVPPECDTIYGWNSLNQETSAAAPTPVAFIPLVTANFHFVEDSAYRQLYNLQPQAKLLPRSKGDLNDRFSAKPFVALALKDLKDPYISGPAPFDWDKISNFATPFLSFSGDNVKSRERFNRQLTYEQLISTPIPGYIYIDNDIDQPENNVWDENSVKKKGNFCFSFAVGKNKEKLTAKHYYLTYAAIPTELIIKADAPANYADGKFSLYALNSAGEKELIIADLSDNREVAATANLSGKELSSLLRGSEAVKGSLRQVGKRLFLQPGKYKLVANNKINGLTAAPPEQDFTVGTLTKSSAAEKLTITFTYKQNSPSQPPMPSKQQATDAPLTTAATTQAQQIGKVAKTGETGRTLIFLPLYLLLCGSLLLLSGHFAPINKRN